jgi:hypothetical protein
MQGLATKDRLQLYFPFLIRSAHDVFEEDTLFQSFMVLL